MQTAIQHKTSLLAQKFPSESQPTIPDLSSHMLFTFWGLEHAKYNIYICTDIFIIIQYAEVVFSYISSTIEAMEAMLYSIIVSIIAETYL